jgi:hypothetical protein
MTLRQSVALQMVRQNQISLRGAVVFEMMRWHEISFELAEYHVSRMDEAEIRQRVRHYIKLGAAEKRTQGAELSAVSPPTNRGQRLFDHVLTPPTTTAGLRHSTAFPESEAQA